MSLLTTKSVPKRILAGVAGLILASSFAGCSNDDAEDLDLEETMDASDSQPTEYIPATEEGPAQNVSEPRLPAVATENNGEGAEATLQFFIAAIDYARFTGDIGPIAMVSTDTCEFCLENIEQWEEIYEEGNWVATEGGLEFEVVDSWIGYDEVDSLYAAEFAISLLQPASDLYEQGDVIDEESVEDENTSSWEVSLIFDATAQRWEVEWMTLLERETGETE